MLVLVLVGVVVLEGENFARFFLLLQFRKVVISLVIQSSVNYEVQNLYCPLSLLCFVACTVQCW